MEPAGFASSISPGRFWTHDRTNYLGSFDLEKWRGIPGFTDFKLVHFVTKRHTLNSSQKSHLCLLFLAKYSFSRYSRFMTTGEDRKKDRFKKLKICDLWKLPFSSRSNKAHVELRLLSESEYQSLCSDFRNSWTTPQGTEVRAGRSRCGLNARPRRWALWAVVLWRHRVRSTVLYDHGRAHI